ncbi:NFACT RNA binding domain-containing protein, partial [Anaerosalibacter bizertensis]|nr:NFACT RNA binding domain-containing protein [Anaerosalibacter bizertensis]
LEKEIPKTEDEIEYLENILVSIENCTEIEELDEIKEELINEGYLKGKNRKKKKSKKQNSSKPYHFISSDGFHIYVGKNNKQNDYLTLRFANKEDIWLHTKDIPGSHVIIRKENMEVPQNTLYEAAILSAFYSKAKNSENVAVDYTEKKHVKKPNGAKPGMVIYEQNSTIYVTPKIEEISKIKKAEV